MVACRFIEDGVVPLAGKDYIHFDLDSTGTDDPGGSIHQTYTFTRTYAAPSNHTYQLSCAPGGATPVEVVHLNMFVEYFPD